MEIGKDLLYLSNADVEGLGIEAGAVIDALEAMFAEKAAGRTFMKPKQHLMSPRGTAFLSMPAGLENPPFVSLKWVGIASNERADPSLPHISGLVTLNDYKTGMPVMVMDARWITGLRTAAVSSVAARKLARKDSASVGFVACGMQARSHLECLLVDFPIRKVVGYSRRLETAEAFCAEVRARGLEAEAVSDPRAAVSDVDIVVTSVPILPPFDPFIDAAWLKPGTFAAMVDLGRSWHMDGAAKMDVVVTDDVDQAGPKGENMGFPRDYDAEVAELVAGTKPGRTDDRQKTALLFGGPALADTAAAALIFDRAKAAGAGRVLKL
jgi:ornithine cyclodeaminase/alanine dehydrogenase-like protein (mu-crystallin family)